MRWNGISCLNYSLHFNWKFRKQANRIFFEQNAQRTEIGICGIKFHRTSKNYQNLLVAFLVKFYFMENILYILHSDCFRFIRIPLYLLEKCIPTASVPEINRNLGEKYLKTSAKIHWEKRIMELNNANRNDFFYTENNWI